jgi:hypothetical protein
VVILKGRGGERTSAIAEKTLISNAVLHSSAVVSATFLTGSKVP